MTGHTSRLHEDEELFVTHVKHAPDEAFSFENTRTCQPSDFWLEENRNSLESRTPRCESSQPVHASTSQPGQAQSCRR